MASPPVALLRTMRLSPQLFVVATTKPQLSGARTGVALGALASRNVPQSACFSSRSPLAFPPITLGSSLDVRTRSFQVSGPGAIDSPLMSSMKQKISEALSTEDVTVQDMQGDGRHVSIRVVAEVFEGKRSVERQRMVYKAIWEELQGAVHAVDSLVTLAPNEA